MDERALTEQPKRRVRPEVVAMVEKIVEIVEAAYIDPYVRRRLVEEIKKFGEVG